MTDTRLKRLARLVKVTGLVHRIQAASLARLRNERAQRLADAAVLADLVDGDEAASHLKLELGLARAVRLRAEAGRAEAGIATGLEAALVALASHKGAAGLHAQTQDGMTRSLAQADLEAVLEAHLVAAAASPAQAAAAMEEQGWSHEASRPMRSASTGGRRDAWRPPAEADSKERDA